MRRQVFTQYAPEIAHLLALWVESWERHGWTPRLLTAADVERFPTQRAAVRSKGGGVYVDPWCLNFGLQGKPGATCRGKSKRHGSLGWEKSPLVSFAPDTPEEIILRCGRWAHD